MANIELPKDAEGREIPLDTVCMYDKDGSRKEVDWYAFYPGEGMWKVVFTDSLVRFPPHNLSLTPPDSWEKLFEDLDKCIKGSSLCMYYSPSGSCSCCTIFGDHSEGCDARALGTIKDRIRKLRGEDQCTVDEKDE